MFFFPKEAGTAPLGRVALWHIRSQKLGFHFCVLRQEVQDADRGLQNHVGVSYGSEQEPVALCSLHKSLTIFDARLASPVSKSAAEAASALPRSGEVASLPQLVGSRGLGCLPKVTAHIRGGAGLGR